LGGCDACGLGHVIWYLLFNRRLYGLETYVDALATYPSLESTCYDNISIFSQKKIEIGAGHERTPYYGQKYTIPDDELTPPTFPIQTDSLLKSLYGSKRPAMNSALAGCLK